MSYFNIRVYGLWLNENNQILISDEEAGGIRFSKFPGGGLQYGEGLREGLKREFLEECQIEIEVLEHFHTTDFFVQSVFNDSQVIAVYYYIKPVGVWQLSSKAHPFDFAPHQFQAFRWADLHKIRPGDVTFPTDKKVVELLKEKWNLKP